MIIYYIIIYKVACRGSEKAKPCSTGPADWERSVKRSDDILQELLFPEPRMFHDSASLPGQHWRQMSLQRPDGFP